MYILLLSDYLDTYAGRDKILRTLSYATKFLTISTSSKSTEKKLKIFSSQMSEGRMILRMLDDLPTFNHVITYGFGKKETDSLIRWSQIMQNAVDMTYCFIEHIYWAGLRNIISINIDKWDVATTWFWIISLHLSLVKSLRKIQNVQKCKIHLGENNPNAQVALEALGKKRNFELLTCTRLMLDISYAVSYLPAGILWGDRLKTWHVGALGTISSLIGLYQALSEKVQDKKCS